VTAQVEAFYGKYTLEIYDNILRPDLYDGDEMLLPAVFRIRIGFMRIRIQHFCGMRIWILLVEFKVF
jgi:hypothetical protein